MMKKLKQILAGLSALAVLSTTPIALNAYSLNPPKPVVQSDERDIHIDVGDDGSKFVYARLEAIENTFVSEIRLNEDGLEKIITQGYSDTFPAFSPDGKKIAFFRNFSMGFGFVYVVDSDGKNLEDIALARIGSVSWSPDGKEIVYKCDYVEEITHILTEEDIEELKLRYNTDNIGFKPGDEIKYNEAYTSINLVDVETKETKYLTTNDGNCENPEFTADGRIVYVINKNLFSTIGKEIWIMDKDGKNKKPLVQPENYEKEVKNDDGTITLYRRESSAYQVSVDGDVMTYMLDITDRVLKIIPINQGWDYRVEILKDEYANGIYVRNLKTEETKLVTDEGSLWFPEIKNNKVYFSRYDDYDSEHNIYCIDLEND